MKIEGKIVWVIGASAGIGEQIALQCARMNAHVILSARRKDQLERVRVACEQLGGRASVVPVDISKPEEIQECCDLVIQEHGRVDLLILHAGISQRGLAVETPIEIDRKFMDINYFGLIAFAKNLLPSMIARGSGHIAVTSSVTGKFGFPRRSAYAASNHALHGFFESLYLENRKYGINTTIVCPGQIQTDISLHALKPDGTPQNSMDPELRAGMPADECARRYLKGIERNKREVYMGRGTILIYLRRFAPRLFFFIAERVNTK